MPGNEIWKEKDVQKKQAVIQTRTALQQEWNENQYRQEEMQQRAMRQKDGKLEQLRKEAPVRVPEVVAVQELFPQTFLGEIGAAKRRYEGSYGFLSKRGTV